MGLARRVMRHLAPSLRGSSQGALSSRADSHVCLSFYPMLWGVGIFRHLFSTHAKAAMLSDRVGATMGPLPPVLFAFAALIATRE